MIVYSFTGICRGRKYDYELTQRGDEYVLSSYYEGEREDVITWANNERNLELILQLCEEIKLR